MKIRTQIQIQTQIHNEKEGSWMSRWAFEPSFQWRAFERVGTLSLSPTSDICITEPALSKNSHKAGKTPLSSLTPTSWLSYWKENLTYNLTLQNGGSRECVFWAWELWLALLNVSIVTGIYWWRLVAKFVRKVCWWVWGRCWLLEGAQIGFYEKFVGEAEAGAGGQRSLKAKQIVELFSLLPWANFTFPLS